MAFPIVTAQEQIGQLYVGYFGRAADPVGLNYWVQQLQGGMSLTAIANSFAVQPEATALYSFLAAPTVGDPAAFITAIYQDLFNRGPDAAGLAYWINQLTVQHTPPGQMVLNIISGAQGADKTTIENKTHVAVDYAQKFVNNNLTWIAIDNIQGAHDVVTPVTFDPLTVTAAILQIDGIITQELTNPQNIQLSPNATSILSGGTVDITLKADPSQANKDFQYTITGIDSSVVKGGSLAGTVKLGTDSKAVIHLDTVVTAAQLNTPNETIKVTVGPISTNVTLTEGKQTLSAPSTVNEGSSFNVSVTTAGVAPGSATGLTQTYTITGPGIGQIPLGERSGTVTLDSDGKSVITFHTIANVFNSTEDPTVTVTVGNDAPINVTIHQAATQSVTPSFASIPEGASVTFTITTAGVLGSAVVGTVETWTLTGSATNQVTGGVLSGTVTLDANGQAVVTVGTDAIFLNGPATQTLTFNLFNGGTPVTKANVTVNEGTQTVSVSPNPVNEGSSFNFEVITSGVAAGSVTGRTETYTITGPGIAQIPLAERSGTVTLDANGHAVVTVHTLANVFNSVAPDPTVTVTVGNDAPVVVTIHEAAVQTITPSAPSINQGSSVTFNVSTAGVPGSAVAGTVETWTLTGAGTGQVTGGILSGTVVLDANGNAAVTVGTNLSVFNSDPTRPLTFNLFNGGTPVTSSTVTINESTMTVTPAPNPIVEGQQVTFTINTTNVPNGTFETWTLSGDALGNVLGPHTGSFTVNGNTATVVIQTFSNDISGLTKGLTLTVDGIPGAVGTVQVQETGPQSFILTTGTDNFVGNKAGGNTFFATANSSLFIPATLGQNDNLNGNSNDPAKPNTLFLTSTGVLLPLLVNSFTTNNIQIFEINPGNLSGNGTYIDMSSAFGVQTITDRNASGTLGLLNLQAPIVLNIFDPSDLGVPVDVGLQYVAGQIPNVNAGAGQIINLDPTVSPITGLPNTAVNAPGVTVFTINSLNATNPNNSQSFNGLVSLNQPLQNAGFPFNTANPLATVNMTGTQGFVLGGVNSGFVGMRFTAFTSTLDLTALHATFFNVGDPVGTRHEGLDFNGGSFFSTFTINGGDGGGSGNPAMEAFYSNPIGLAGPVNGGVFTPGTSLTFFTIRSEQGNVQVNIGSGDFMGQGIRTQTNGNSVTINGTGAGLHGGYVDDVVNAAGIWTNSGAVSVTNLDRGLGSVRVENNANSYILTNTIKADGGNVFVQNINGGVDTQVSTGNARAQFLLTGNTGDMILDFSRSNLPGAGNNTGFHGAHGGVLTDEFFGGTGVNTLIFDPSINNNNSVDREGNAKLLQNLILQNDQGTLWANTVVDNGQSGVNPSNSVGLTNLGNNTGKPIDVYIGGNGNTANLAFPINTQNQDIDNVIFTGAVNNERFFVDTFSTNNPLNDTFSFDFGGTTGNTLNLIVQNGTFQNHHVSVSDFSVAAGAGKNSLANNPISRLNFTATTSTQGSGAVVNLTINQLQQLTRLDLIGTSRLYVDSAANGLQAATISIIDGTLNDSNTDITGLMKGTSTDNQNAGLFVNTKYLNPGSGPANALAAAGGSIHLGLGTNRIAVAGGSWNIISDGFGTTIVVNPKSGDIDTIHATGGNVTVTIGANDGAGGVAGGGQVSIVTDKGGNRFVFDQQGLPQLQSADFIHAGNGPGGKNDTAQFDTIQIINGPLTFFDAGFAQVTGVERLQLAAGFSNQLQLDFSADNNVATNQSGQLEVITGGGGFFQSSTAVNVGAGFNHPLLFTVTAGGDGGGDNVTTHLSSKAGSNPLTVSGAATDILISFESAAFTIQPGIAEGIFASTTAANEVKLIADGNTIPLFGLGTSAINGVQTFTGVANGLQDLGVVLLNNGVAAGSPEVVNLSAITGNTFVDASLLTKSVSIDGGQGNVIFFNTVNTLIGSQVADQLRGHGFDSLATNTTVFFGGLGGDKITLSTDGGLGIGGADVVAYNSHFESTVGSTDLVENFHGGPGGDTFFFNPAEFVFPTLVFVGPNGGAASYADALTFLNPLNLNTQAVLINTGGSTGQLWVDVDHDQNLNAGDYVINMTFASPPFLTSANFPQIPPATISFPAYAPLPLTPPAPAVGVLPTMTTTIAAYNAALPPTKTTSLNFVGAGGTVTRPLNPLFTNYNFAALIGLGVVATTENWFGGPVFDGGHTSLITGSKFDDVIRATAFDLKVAGNGLAYDGGLGTDKLVLRPGTTPTTTVVLGPTPAAGFNPVTNVETLDIDNQGKAMDISFSSGVGQAFTNINGMAGNTAANTIHTKNLVAGGLIDLSKDVGADIVHLDANLAGTTIKLNGLGTVNINFTGAVTTTIVGLLNLDQVVLNAGDVDYDLSGASITDVTQLDMRQANFAGDVTLNTAQVGGLKGFTKILIDAAGNSDLFLAPGGDPIAADFTNVALSTTNYELHVGSGDTVKMLPLQLPLQGIDGPADQKMALIFTINNPVVPIVMNGSTYNDLGSVSWQTGILSFDNAALGTGARPHGITELHGNNSSTLLVTSGAAGASMDLSNLTKFDGIKTLKASLDDGSTLRMNSDQLIAMNTIGNAEIQAGPGLFGVGNDLNLVIDSAKSYDISTPLGATSPQQLALTDFGAGEWKSVDFDGDNTGGLTIKITDNMLDQSDIDTVFGDTSGAQTDSLIVYNHNSGPATTTDLSDIDTFDGFMNISVIEQYSVPPGNTFHVVDVLSNEAISNSGVASIDLNKVTGDVAWLDTTKLSVQTTLNGPGASNPGKDTHWDISNFNAGALGATILKITDTTIGGGTDVKGVTFINATNSNLVTKSLNLVSANVATVTNFEALNNNSTVEQALVNIAGLKTDVTGKGLGGGAATAADHAYVGIYGGGPETDNLGIYEVIINDTALGGNTTLTANTISVNLIGIIHNVTNNSMDINNFAP